MTSHVSWSIGFEVSLADSFADHFLEHVNFWAMMCTFYSKGRSCKNLQTPSETFKNAYKNHQTPIPKSRSHCVKFCFSPFFSNMPQKMEKMVRSAFFVGTVLRELCLWRIRSMVMVASLNTVCARASPCFVGDNSKLPGFFHDPLLYSMQRVGEWHKIGGCSTGHEVHDRFLEISTKTSTFWIIVQKKKNIHRGGPVGYAICRNP